MQTLGCFSSGHNTFYLVASGAHLEAKDFLTLSATLPINQHVLCDMRCPGTAQLLSAHSSVVALNMVAARDAISARPDKPA